jgi:hypothetical protein
MADKLRAAEVANDKIDGVESTTTQPALVPLDQVVSKIRQDSQENSSEYLEDTVVPKGGE